MEPREDPVLRVLREGVEVILWDLVSPQERPVVKQ